MPQTVEFPNLGTVEFPDEFTPEEIQQRIPGVRTQLLQEREKGVAAQTATQPGGRQSWVERLAAPVEKPGDYFGIGDEVTGTWNALRRGELRGQQALEVMEANQASRPPTMREERTAYVQGMTDPRRISQPQEVLNVDRYLRDRGGKGVPYWDPNMRLERLASPEAKLDALVSPREAARTAALADVAATQRKIEAIPRSEDMATLGSDFWGTLRRNPIETIAEVSAESLPQSLLGTVVGGSVGPAGMILGTAANSYLTDFAANLLQSAQESGVDLTNEQQLQAFFSDPVKLRKARNDAKLHGVPVAIFDGLSAGLAGKILGPAMGLGVKKVLAASAGELGMQMATGAAGEAAGQIAQSGEITSVPDVVMEALGELGTAPAETYGNLRDNRAQQYAESPAGRKEAAERERKGIIDIAAREMDRSTRKDELALPQAIYARTRTLREPQTQVDTGQRGVQPGAEALREVSGIITLGDPVTATMPDGKQVTGVVVGGDVNGNAVLGTENGATVTLPEKLEGGRGVNQVQGGVEVSGQEPPVGTPQDATGQPGGLQPPAGEGGTQGTGLPPEGSPAPPTGPTPAPPAPAGTAVAPPVATPVAPNEIGRGLLYDEEQRVLSELQPGGTFRGPMATEQSKSHAIDIIKGLQQGDIVEDSEGRQYRVVVSKKGSKSLDRHAPGEEFDGAPTGGISRIDPTTGEFVADPDMISMVSRGRILRNAAPTPTETPAQSQGPQLTEADVIAEAEKQNPKVPWDDDPAFLAWTAKLTGVPSGKLSDLSPAQLKIMVDALKNGDRPAPAPPQVYKARMQDIGGTPTDFEVTVSDNRITLWQMMDGQRTGSRHFINLPADMQGQVEDPVKFQELLNSGLKVAYVTTPETGTVTTLVRVPKAPATTTIQGPTRPGLTPEENKEVDDLLDFKKANGGTLGRVNAARLEELQKKITLPPPPQDLVNEGIAAIERAINANEERLQVIGEGLREIKEGTRPASPEFADKLRKDQSQVKANLKKLRGALEKARKAPSTPSPAGPAPAPTGTATAPPEPTAKTTEEKLADIHRKREEIRKRMQDLMGGTSMGVDPKWLLVTTELLGTYIQEGVVRFADFVKRFSADMPEVWEKFKNYAYLAWNEAIDKEPTLQPVSAAEAKAAVTAADAGTQGPPPTPPKQVEEEREAQMTGVAINIAKSGGPPLDIYRSLVKLYDEASRLGIRTAESKTNQAYSTPPPLAYIASLAADLSNGTLTMFPTAGNGMNAVGANPNSEFLANDIDPNRTARLENNLTAALGAEESAVTVTNLDATSPEFQTLATQFAPDRISDNPPFGSRLLPNGQTEQFPIHGGVTVKTTTPSIDLAIMLNSLEAMAPNGQAVFIVGAKTGSPFAQFGSVQSRAFSYHRPEYLELFKRFNVVDMFTVAGPLYDKMGAGWPVDVIVVRGKGETPSAKVGGLVRPWITPPPVFDSWAALEGKVQQYGSGRTEERPGEGGGNVPPEGAPAPAEGGAVAGGGVVGGGRTRKPRAPRGGSAGGGSQTGAGAGPSQGGPGELGGNIPGGEPGGVPGATAGVAETPADQTTPAGRPGGSVPTAPAGLASGTKLNTPYVSVSNNVDPKLVVPSNLADAMRFAVKDLEREVGIPVDDFVEQKMGWNRAQLYSRLSSAQIEAVALAIRNIDRGSALINGDQTGVGKGRTAAAIIAYAIRSGKIPIFITAKPSLYTDMLARDLVAIGAADVLPFITNTEYNYINGRGVEVKSRSSKRDEMMEIAANGKLPAGVHAIFTTYDQLKNDRPQNFSESKKEKRARKKNRRGKPDGPRYTMIKALAPNAILIMDEAHEAAGKDSDVNIKLQDEVIPLVSGSYMLTATFSKRADSMGLYSAATLMRRMGTPKKLVDLIKHGGNALFQALSNMLASSGEFVRREQNFEGVEVNFVQATENPEQEIEAADDYTSFLRELDQLSRQVARAAAGLEDDENQTTAEDAPVEFESVNFGARIYNLSQQYLLALRAKTTVQQALKVLAEPALDADGKPMLDKNGQPLRQKPFITLYNTMQGPIADLIHRKLSVDFNGILHREMQKMLEIKVKDPSYVDPGGDHDKDGIRTVIITPADLPDGGAMYNRLWEHIKTSDLTNFPVSPIDYIKRELEKHGVRVAEITGRKGELEEEPKEGEEPQLTPREIQDRKEILAGYNGGLYDAIVVNGSSATGVSAHAAPEFADQRRRVMIISQPQADVNAMMQMLGRIMRFGQTSTPKFIFLRSALAAEKRFMTLLRSNLSSLNANTSADTESSYTQGGLAQDVFNEIGDDIVNRVLQSEPEAVDTAGINMPDPEEPETVRGFARRSTGRFPLLPNADAQKLWAEIDDRYRREIEHLDAIGENPLKATPEDLRAKIVEATEYTNGTGNTLFDGPSQLEQVNVQILHEPITHAQAIAMAETNDREARRSVHEWIGLNRAAEQARLKTAGERGATIKQLDDIRARFSEARDKVASALTRLGRTFAYDQTGSGEAQYYVVPVNIKLVSKDITDLGSASKQDLILATNTSRPSVPIAISKSEGDDVYLSEPRGDGEELFDSSSAIETTRYIVTGNLLAGFEQARNRRAGLKPRVVMFTRDDGSVHTGILMPVGYQPKSDDEVGQPKITSADEFMRLVQANVPVAAGEIRIIDRVVTLPANNQFKKIWSNDRYQNFVPSNQQRGNVLVGRVEQDVDAFHDFFNLVVDNGFVWHDISGGHQHSLKPQLGPGMAVDAVKALIAEVSARAPVSVSNEDPPVHNGHRVRGVVRQDGSITLYARALDSNGEARAVLFEELGHLVGRQPEYWPVYRRLASLITKPEIDAMLALGYDQDEAVEEAIMRRIVDAEERRNAEGAFARAWNDIKEWLTRFLREWGVITNTELDLREMVRATVNVGAFPDVRDSYSHKPNGATPVPEPKTARVGLPANQIFANKSQLEEQILAPGQTPEQNEALQSIGTAAAGLIPQESGDQIKQWAESDNEPANIAARELNQVQAYLDMKNAGKDAAIVPSADGFTVLQIPEGERSIPSNQVIYTHENLNRSKNRMLEQLSTWMTELSKAGTELQDAHTLKIPERAASNLAEDTIKNYEQYLVAMAMNPSRKATQRQELLTRIGMQIQRAKVDLAEGIESALLKTANRIPEGVLNGTEWVTDAGGAVPANTPGSVGGVAGIIRWIKGQTMLNEPVAGDDVVNWLTTPDETGRTPLSFGRELLGRLGIIRKLSSDKEVAGKVITDTREWFNKNAGTDQTGPVTIREFAQRYFRWETSRREAQNTMKVLDRNYRNSAEMVTGLQMALDELERIQQSPQYGLALKAAVTTLNASAANIYGLTQDGRIYYPTGPLAGPQFEHDQSRLIDFSPEPLAIDRNTRNAQAMAQAIDQWLHGPGNELRDPAEKVAWSRQLDWIRAHAMLDTSLQWNYSKLGMGVDMRPFGITSRIMLNLGFPGPPQGIKAFLPGIALHEFTRSEHRHAQLATELDELMRNPNHGWFAVQNAIIAGAKSHKMGGRDESIVQRIGRFPGASNRAAMSDEIYLTYIPQFLSEITSKNESLGGILLGVGDRLSNEQIITEEDMAAVRMMKQHMDKFYKILQDNPSFVENKLEPLQIRDEETNRLRNLLHSHMLIRMRRSHSWWGLQFASDYLKALERDELGKETLAEGEEFVPNDERKAHLQQHIRVLNDYWMTTNTEFTISGFNRADAVTKAAHRARAAEQKAHGKKGAPNLIFHSVDDYLDWIAQEHVDAADDDKPTDFATERVRAEEALFKAFDSYTRAFVTQREAERIDNEAESIVSVANNPVGPLTRPRKQMVAPDYFYNYAVATKADYGFMRAKALLPHVAQIVQKLESIHASLKKEVDRRETELRSKEGRAKVKANPYPTSLRMLKIAQRMVGRELETLQTNVNQTVKTVYDSDALSIAQRIEESLSMGLLAAISPTMNNVFTALAGQAFMGTMAGKVGRAFRFPLTIANLHKRVLRFLLTGGGNQQLAAYIRRHKAFFGRISGLMIRVLIDEENRIQAYREKAGVQKVQGIKERLKTLRDNPDTYGEDFGPHRLGTMERTMNRVMARFEGIIFPEALPIIGGKALPLMAGVRDWTSYIDSKTVAALGFQFDESLDRMKNALLEAMSKRESGETEVANWNDPNKPLTQFRPEELGLKTFRELEWFRQQLRPVGSLEYLAWRYWKATKDKTPGTEQLDTQFASPEEYGSMLREFIRMSGNPVDALNRITRHKPSGVLKAVQQFMQRFQQWSSNYASALNRGMTLDSRDSVTDNAMHYARAMMLLLVLIGGSMWWTEEKAEVQTALTGREPSIPRAASVQDFGDAMRYAVASVTPTILPYYGEMMQRLLGGSANRPLFDATAAVPALNFAARFADMIPKIVQSKDPFLPLYDFIRQSFPITQIPLHAAAQFSPLLKGEERAAAAAAAVRSAAPSDMEKVGGAGGGRGGTLTPMSAFVRRAVDYAYAGDEARSKEQIEKAVQYQMSRGRDEKTARRIVSQSLATRAPTRRVIGRLATEPEAAQLTGRMTSSQLRAYGHGQEAFQTLGGITGSRLGLVRSPRSRSTRGASRSTRSLTGGRRSAFGRGTGGRRTSLSGQRQRRRRSRSLAAGPRTRSMTT